MFRSQILKNLLLLLIFIAGRRLLNLPDHLGYVCDPDDEDFEVNPSQLTKRMKHLAKVLNHFWRRWRSEYLNERVIAKKVSHPLHVTKALPRGLWKLSRIQEVFTGRDGLPHNAF